MTSWWDIWLPKAKNKPKAKVELTGYFDSGGDTYMIDGSTDTINFYNFNGVSFSNNSAPSGIFYEC